VRNVSNKQAPCVATARLDRSMAPKEAQAIL